MGLTPCDLEAALLRLLPQTLGWSRVTRRIWGWAGGCWGGQSRVRVALGGFWQFVSLASFSFFLCSFGKSLLLPPNQWSCRVCRGFEAPKVGVGLKFLADALSTFLSKQLPGEWNAAPWVDLCECRRGLGLWIVQSILGFVVIFGLVQNTRSRLLGWLVRLSGLTS